MSLLTAIYKGNIIGIEEALIIRAHLHNPYFEHPTESIRVFAHKGHSKGIPHFEKARTNK